jgi:SAM-dependent methyltransferase
MNDPSPPKRPHDTWASGAAYEPYVGRWSRLVARQFLHWLAVAPASRWLDVGCGTGALTQTILEIATPAHVTGIDRSDGYISYAQAHVQDPHAHFEVGDAQALTDQPASYDAAVSGLMLNFLPQPEQAAREMARVVQPSGIVAAYVWDYGGKMQLMRHFWNAAVALDPDAFDLDEGRRFPFCQPEPLTELFRRAGLTQVEVHAIDVATDFQDFDDYWSPFLGGQGPAPSYVMALSDERRAALRERIRTGLPFALNGSIPLIARAWAVRGRSQ